MFEAMVTESRILIVDDQEANVRLLELILRRAGYKNLHMTTDPRTVEALVADVHPDLILLDLNMPYLDGEEVLERLTDRRSQEGYLPVLVLTADADPGRRRRALEHGANDYVTKPFEADEVLLRCRNMLHTRTMYRQLHEQNRVLEHEATEMAVELTQVQLAHADIIDSLNRFSPSAHVDETAAALCRELVRSPQFDVVAVLAFEGDDTIVPIASAGSLDVSSVLGRPLPGGRAARIMARSEGPPWAAPWSANEADGPYGAALEAAGLKSTWYAPLLADDGVVGLIVAGTSAAHEQTELDRRLPALVEFSAIARVLLGPGLSTRRVESQSRATLVRLIRDKQFHPVFQPIIDIRNGATMGFEGLTRFADGERPDVRFDEARRLGVGLMLEEVTLAAALEASHALPPKPFLSLNVSPAMLRERGRLASLLTDLRRLIVLEITEHVAIDDYAGLRDAISLLGPHVRLAIDDAGAGFASFRHILELRPDFVKLDRELVHDVEADPSRQALVVGMRYFAQKTGCTLISEGVETEAERATLAELGIEFGQGYLFGRPLPVSELMAEVPA